MTDEERLETKRLADENNRDRQKAWRKNQKKRGRNQLILWVTPEEKKKIKEYLSSLR